MDWMERAELELENDLASGIIDASEYNDGLLEIGREAKEEREDARHQLRDNH